MSSRSSLSEDTLSAARSGSYQHLEQILLSLPQCYSLDIFHIFLHQIGGLGELYQKLRDRQDPNAKDLPPECLAQLNSITLSLAFFGRLPQCVEVHPDLKEKTILETSRALPNIFSKLARLLRVPSPDPDTRTPGERVRNPFQGQVDFEVGPFPLIVHLSLTCLDALKAMTVLDESMKYKMVQLDMAIQVAVALWVMTLHGHPIMVYIRATRGGDASQGAGAGAAGPIHSYPTVGQGDTLVETMCLIAQANPNGLATILNSGVVCSLPTFLTQTMKRVQTTNPSEITTCPVSHPSFKIANLHHLVEFTHCLMSEPHIRDALFKHSAVETFVTSIMTMRSHLLKDGSLEASLDVVRDVVLHWSSHVFEWSGYQSGSLLSNLTSIVKAGMLDVIIDSFISQDTRSQAKAYPETPVLPAKLVSDIRTKHVLGVPRPHGNDACDDAKYMLSVLLAYANYPRLLPILRRQVDAVPAAALAVLSERDERLILYRAFEEEVKEGRGFLNMRNRVEICDNVDHEETIRPVIPCSGRKGRKPQTCSKCHSVVYCSRECQKRDWDYLHRRECPRAHLEYTDMKHSNDWYSHPTRAFHLSVLLEAFEKCYHTQKPTTTDPKDPRAFNDFKCLPSNGLPSIFGPAWDALGDRCFDLMAKDEGCIFRSLANWIVKGGGRHAPKWKRKRWNAMKALWGASHFAHVLRMRHPASATSATLNSPKVVKLPRSRSSPSPPALRSDQRAKHGGQRFRRRLGSVTANDERGKVVKEAAAIQGWSTSYHAGSSSSESPESSEYSDSETDTENGRGARGRRASVSRHASGDGANPQSSPSSFIRPRSPDRDRTSSGESSTTGAHSVMARTRKTFTRSRSPVVTRKSQPSIMRHLSPTALRPARRHPLLIPISLLPANVALRIPYFCAFSVDTRKLGEFVLLLGSLLYATSYLSPLGISPSHIQSLNDWQALELRVLAFLSTLYFIWAHSSPISSPKESVPSLSSTVLNRPGSPRHFDAKSDARKVAIPLNTINKSGFGYIWMSVPKNYRESRDDGMATGLLLGPLIATCLLISGLRSAAAFPKSALPDSWLIEPPLQLGSATAFDALSALVESRRGLVDLSTFCSVILLANVCASWFAESRYQKIGNKPEGERASVPRSEARRFLYYVLYTLGSSVVLTSLRVYGGHRGIEIWQRMSHFEAVVASVFYPFTLYAGLRLAHRGFTVGELGLVCFGGTALCLEFLQLTVAKIWPVTTPIIRTYRLPNPLLIFQVALIVGSFLTGFLLSPFLVLSRNTAQRPAHRLRFPEEKLRNRRYYALGFYIGTLLCVGGLIGLWTRWCLGSRDPWLWTVFYLTEGRKKWSRPVILGYWGLLGCISVAGWGRQVARSRRFRLRNQTGAEDLYSPTSSFFNASGSAGESSMGSTGSGNSLVGSFPTLPNISMPSMPSLPNGSGVSNVATDLLDAADKQIPTLSLNARRKFFHGLSVAMFIPGIALDPAFTHLAFSVAFAFFTFVEYVRYFAVYPFGAAIHIFMNEFLDHRDSGTAILSHFYLLTGCAGSVWLQDPSPILLYTGVLTLGVGIYHREKAGIAQMVAYNEQDSRRDAGVHRVCFYKRTTSPTVWAGVFLFGPAIPGGDDNWGTVRSAVGPERQSDTAAVHVECLTALEDGWLWSWTLKCAKTNEDPPMHDKPIVEAKPTVKALHPDDIQHTDSLAFVPAANTNLIVNGAHPPPSFLTQTKQPRRPARPQTAPSQEQVALLPSAFRAHTISLPASPYRESPSRSASGPNPELRDALQSLTTEGQERSDREGRSRKHAEWTLLSEAEITSGSADCDWATFIAAYANGRWDPHKVPNPPRSYHTFSSETGPNTEAVKLSNSLPKECKEHTYAEDETWDPKASTSSQGSTNASTNATATPVPPVVSSSIPPKASRIQKRAAIDLPLTLSLPGSSYRTRSSFSSTASTGSTASGCTSSTSASNTDITTAVAAMRWAAARVDISPLALPSPEHELTDPMRGVTAALPHSSSHKDEFENVTTPGGTRRSRLASFWEGTTDVDVTDSPRIASIPLVAGGGGGTSRPPRVSIGVTTPSSFVPIQISETAPTPEEASAASQSPSSALSDPTTQLSLLAAPPPATAPILGKGAQSPAEGSDYFGNAAATAAKTKAQDTRIAPPQKLPPGPDFTSPSDLSASDGTLSVPALPRKVCLTRQTSSPLPMSLCLHDSLLPGGRAAGDNVAAVKVGRAAKEEQMFNELGYLAPPNPPDELERRRALYKFNIWNTGPDLNFDRIAHLAKLVFNTRGVIISLIDGNEQWFKSECNAEPIFLYMPSYPSLPSFSRVAFHSRWRTTTELP
ncbi:hypothetical protein NMY22_g6544 [Coprinellus aureogranulatus]|nr:hypothetical protein NMY22_g6544 [Coprinellus aureogranulatus]